MLKAGLVKKAQVAQAARDQARLRQGKKPPPPTEQALDAERARSDRVERDRALDAARTAQRRVQEQRAQVRQLVETQRVHATGEIEYRFVDGNAIRSILVDAALRTQLAGGALVIVRHDRSYALVSRATAAKVGTRDPSMIVVDHGPTGTEPVPDSDNDPYAQFKVPDDLSW